MILRSAAILAGGDGRRLGGAVKELLDIEGEPAGPRLARILRERFDTVIVVTKNPGLYSGSVTTSDIEPGFGPLSGLHAALSACADDWLWLAACDMPAFDARLVKLFLSRLGGLGDPGRAAGESPPIACVARFGAHFEPFQALYSRRLLPRLEGLFGTARKAGPDAPDSVLRPSFKELFAGQDVEFVPEAVVRTIDPGWSLFFNINTPEDLERLEAPAKRDFRCRGPSDREFN
jgi:molybdopterin-guanine dinucleotide biosynthesis protein A